LLLSVPEKHRAAQGKVGGTRNVFGLQREKRGARSSVVKEKESEKVARPRGGELAKRNWGQRRTILTRFVTQVRNRTDLKKPRRRKEIQGKVFHGGREQK